MSYVTTDRVRRGQILRRPNARASERVYYTLPAKSAGKTVEARQAYYIKQLRGRLAKLDSHKQFLLARLEEGWVPLWRHRRYIDKDGARAEVKNELCAAPADYRWRVVKHKPGYQ